MVRGKRRENSKEKSKAETGGARQIVDKKKEEGEK